MTLSSRLKKKRKEHELSQTKLAEICGVSQGTIAQIEDGRILRTSHILKLAAALEVNPAWLEYGDGLEDDQVVPLKTIQLNAQEKRLLYAYRDLNQQDRKSMLRIIEALVSK